MGRSQHSSLRLRECLHGTGGRASSREGYPVHIVNFGRWVSHCEQSSMKVGRCAPRGRRTALVSRHAWSRAAHHVSASSHLETKPRWQPSFWWPLPPRRWPSRQRLFYTRLITAHGASVHLPLRSQRPPSQGQVVADLVHRCQLLWPPNGPQGQQYPVLTTTSSLSCLTIHCLSSRANRRSFSALS